MYYDVTLCSCRPCINLLVAHASRSTGEYKANATEHSQTFPTLAKRPPSDQPLYYSVVSANLSQSALASSDGRIHCSTCKRVENLDASLRGMRQEGSCVFVCSCIIPSPSSSFPLRVYGDVCTAVYSKRFTCTAVSKALSCRFAPGA